MVPIPHGDSGEIILSDDLGCLPAVENPCWHGYWKSRAELANTDLVQEGLTHVPPSCGSSWCITCGEQVCIAIGFPHLTFGGSLSFLGSQPIRLQFTLVKLWYLSKCCSWLQVMGVSNRESSAIVLVESHKVHKKELPDPPKPCKCLIRFSSNMQPTK